ncbi:hypothetical protein [Mesobacillus maritimus]|uniref:hypothetical protein n=1 Tax=Mesobacillus maritimus TaxID=1643336 RepID=UPI00384D4607
MDRAIIIGTFGFLGYSICRAMLDEGVEVNAIPVGEEPDCFIEEKRMEIGRNANFCEEEVRILNEWKGEALIPVIIPFFDFYLMGMEEKLFENYFLQEELFSLPPEKFPIILLIPEQLEYDGTSKFEPLVNLKQNLTKKGFLLKEVLVPTLYGPWQPEGCFFQQILSLGVEAVTFPSLNSRESTSDAIYVADAATIVRDLLEEARSGKYVMRSGKKSGWCKCLESIYYTLLKSKELGEEKKSWENELKNMMKLRAPLNQEQKLSEDYRRVYVQKPMDTLEGLEQQRKQYLRLLKGKHD